jgi:hypothetical protein
MSCYLYSMDNRELTQSTTLSRLVLDLVRPFTQEANRVFVLEATAKRDAELERLRKEGVAPGFGDYDIDDPLSGLEGVRGKAFVLADGELPQEFEEALAAGLVERGKDTEAIRQEYPNARHVIADLAIAGTDVLIR